MHRDEFFESVFQAITSLVSGRLSGKAFVATCDSLFANELPENLPENVERAIDSFQNEIGLYVENPEWRAEDPGYFGIEELLRKTAQFKQALIESGMSDRTL